MTSLPNYAMLNFRSQSAPKFTSTQRLSKVTGKQETFYDIQNDAGYTFRMVTPPCNALFPHLGEGGNFGGKFSQTKGTSNIVTNLLLATNFCSQGTCPSTQVCDNGVAADKFGWKFPLACTNDVIYQTTMTEYVSGLDSVNPPQAIGKNERGRSGGGGGEEKELGFVETSILGGSFVFNCC